MEAGLIQRISESVSTSTFSYSSELESNGRVLLHMYVELETLLETLVGGQPRSDRRRPTLDRDAWDASEEPETATNADL